MAFYDNYIQLLVKEGRGMRRWRWPSRASARRWSKAWAWGKQSLIPARGAEPVANHPEDRRNAAFLQAWERSAYLWAITPEKITLIRLLAQKKIEIVTCAKRAAYLTGNPAQYASIHFVSHAVSSRMDPLDSASSSIGLRSRSTPAGKSL